MSEKKKRFRWVPHIIRHDFWRKFFALIFALLVTATVYSDKRKHEDELFVIHNVQPTLGLESGYVWRARNLQQVSLTVRGPKAKLFDLKPEDFTLDYMIGEKEYNSKNKNGRQFVTLQAKDVVCRHPKGALLQVLEITPAEYTFTIDKIITKNVPLKAEYAEQDLPQGYQVGKVTFPDTKVVSVTGPESLLKDGMTINTKPIPLKNHVADFTTSVGLHPIEGLSYGTDQVRVSVKLKKRMKTVCTDLKISLVLPPGMEERFQVEKFEPETVNVTVVGEEEAVTALKNNPDNYLLVYLDLNEINSAGTYDIPIRCSVRNRGMKGITSVTCSRAKIPKVIVTERPVTVSTILSKTDEKKPDEKKPEEKKPEEKKPEVKKQ